MTWTSLRERFTSLPSVLAGPILRHVGPDEVTVWVALKQATSVTLNVLNSDEQPLFSGQQSTVKLGLNLHIAAITARRESHPPLQPGQVYLYDLVFSNGTQLRGSALGNTTSYAPFALPSFTLPPTDLKDVRLIHGSCRKPHGPSLDAMPALDEIVRKDAVNPLKRPHQLFLTGDQIYADDVADVLLYLLRDADSILIDWRETLPNNPADKDLLPGNRTPLTRRAGLTASLDDDDTTAKSHLLTFGEYAMMYLFAWSDALWPAQADLPSFETVFPTAQGRTDSDTEYTRIRFEAETKALKDFRRDLQRVRRALANIPTYMIFDDHEITDDWFINLDWCKSVMEAPLGRRVIQNGMLAYALFQAWGNTPASFEAGPGHDLLTAMNALADSNGSDDAARHQIANRLGLPFDQVEADLFVVELQNRRFIGHTGDNPWHNGISWHYLLAGPGHEALVLDTRTWRAYPDKRADGFPVLISQDGLRTQILELAPPNGDVTIVISAAPFIGTPLGDMYQAGFPWIDWLIELLGGGPVRLSRDSEAWGLNRGGCGTLARQLNAPRIHR